MNIFKKKPKPEPFAKHSWNIRIVVKKIKTKYDTIVYELISAELPHQDAVTCEYLYPDTGYAISFNDYMRGFYIKYSQDSGSYNEIRYEKGDQLSLSMIKYLCDRIKSAQNRLNIDREQSDDNDNIGELFVITNNGIKVLK